MHKSAHKIALAHDDAEIAERISRVAAAAGLLVVRAPSFSALLNHIDDPLLSAVVIDVAAPRDGGIDLLKRLYSPSSRARIVVIGAWDAKAADATHRLAQSRGIDIAVFRKQGIDDDQLARQLCAGRDGGQRFGPAELDDSLEKGFLRVEYQPKVPLTANGVFGVEALCRIRHPEFGIISPDRFVPLAETCGLIFKLTDAVACEAFRAHRAWRDAGLALRLAINVSPELLRENEWSNLFLQRCAEYRVDPKSITLEITESAAGATDPAACEVLTALRARGFTLSIDDFGTGFSSLSTLYRLPVGELKIDKSFILDLQGSSGARTLVESTVSMAQRIGLKVVAEGVESEAVFRELRQMGIHEAQGYFVGKSMPPEDVIPFFTSWKKAMSEPAAAAPAKALPKIAVVQALLNEIAQENGIVAETSPRGRGNSDASGARELVQRLPQLVLGGDPIAALAHCHAALRQMEKTPTRSELRDKLTRLQTLLEDEVVTTSDLELVGAQGAIKLLPRSSVTLGRPSVAGDADMSIQCRWMSPRDKNLRFFFEADDWYLEDRGSPHGHFIDGTRVATRRPVMLPIGETVLDIGMASGSIAPLSIVLRRPSAAANALVVDFHFDPDNLIPEIGSEQWPALERDLGTTWIAFQGQITVGRAPQLAMVLSDCTLPTAATITFNDGFWIAPAADTFIGLGESVFHQPVPLPSKGDLRLAGVRLSLRQPRPTPISPVQRAPQMRSRFA
jgi:EAL domain-containing protein (putative c-di-GMP-specific phosphodiesterase class I)